MVRSSHRRPDPRFVATTEDPRAGADFEPCMLLLAAVLERALLDANRPAMSVADKEARDDARRWIMSDVDAVWSFVWVCDILGLTPECLRRPPDRHWLRRQSRRAGRLLTDDNTRTTRKHEYNKT